MKTPKEVYQAHLTADEIQYDTLQAGVVDKLESLFRQLLDKPSLLQSMRLVKPLPIKGLYLWGNVGAGKTYLMDLFFNALPFPEKQRLHFHVFMKNTHDELKTLQGQKNPLKTLAKRIAKKTRVLCFDEFHVNDIADAMLLRGLFTALFDAGVVLVTTSNVPTEKLYWNGLQRQQFLPVIALLEEKTDVIHLSNQIDYRLQYLTDAGVYHTPLNDETRRKMEEGFKQLAGMHVRKENRLNVLGRYIPVLGLSEDVAWFEFSALCGIPRCQRDYIDIVGRFKAVLVSGIPVLRAEQRDLTRSFINLVDVFYDAHMKVMFSASTPIEEIYPTGPLSFEFKRTVSRLQEMRSSFYLFGEASS